MKASFNIQRVSGLRVSDEELVADLQATAAMTGEGTIGMLAYRVHGKFDDTTITRRFGNWNKALAAAGLVVSNRMNLSDEHLFENILCLWQRFGRQPRRSELSAAPSTVSQSPYNRRFGSWSGALEAFVAYANQSEAEAPAQTSSSVGRKRTGRDPSFRLRWRVLQRDRFTCCACGRSAPEVDLHIDHILAWSKGGETVIENLQTLCLQCNLGKSNE